jgi:hypothetical protein
MDVRARGESVEGVAGAPVPAAEYWACTGHAGAFGPPAVALVLADVFGVGLHSHAEVKVRALSLDLIAFDLHPGRVPGAGGRGPEHGWTGLSAPDVAALCASYGVALEPVAAGPDDLAAHLRAGDAVLVCVDGEALRGGPATGPTLLGGAGLDALHALALTGLDAAGGLVYLNNPADPAGTGLVLPLAEFAAAWAEAGGTALRAPLPRGSALADLGTWAFAGAAGGPDPWAGLADTVVLAPPEPGPRRLVWLPFSYVLTAASPAQEPPPADGAAGCPSPSASAL